MSSADATRSATAGPSGTWWGRWEAIQIPPMTISAIDVIAIARDGRQPALGHPVATLVMITSVATCIAPMTPAV